MPQQGVSANQIGPYWGQSKLRLSLIGVRASQIKLITSQLVQELKARIYNNEKTSTVLI
jgi:hypothetical protein